MDIHLSCLLNAINIDMQWIPRDLNSVADDISKFVDYEDYMITELYGLQCSWRFMGPAYLRYVRFFL